MKHEPTIWCAGALSLAGAEPSEIDRTLGAGSSDLAADGEALLTATVLRRARKAWKRRAADGDKAAAVIVAAFDAAEAMEATNGR